MIRTRVGYTGGTTTDPTYRNMGDHAEALQIDFDSRVISYESLLSRFWKSHDPTEPPYSTQYRSSVYAGSTAQLTRAEATGVAAAAARGGTLQTPVVRATRFYRAEDYHQKYRLRRHRKLAEALIERFGSDRAMVDSTVAARLNGCLSSAEGLVADLFLDRTKELESVEQMLDVVETIRLEHQLG